jgi:serine/threonine protein kinase
MRKLSSGDKLVNKYLVVRELGRGATGEVYMVRDEETGQSYAMKVTNRYAAGWSEDSQRNRSIALEIAVMKKLQHENIVNLIEVIDDPKNRKIFLVQELMEGGALMPDLEKQDPMINEVAWKYFRDVVAGLAYLHAEGVIHRDIKPQNILLTADGKAKIADFGAAVFVEAEEGKVAYAGTPAFMSPELFLSSEVAAEFSKSPAIDIFALGATLFCMVVGNPPWMANNQIELALKISNDCLEFPDQVYLDPHLKHLLGRMLEKDPELRIDLDGIVEDDWVTHEGMDPFFFEGGPGDLMSEVDDVTLDENTAPEAGLELDITDISVEKGSNSVEPRRVVTPTKISSSKHATMKLRDNGHVLIIDDSPVARKLLSIQVYRATGYQACATASGAEALDMLKMIEESGGAAFDAILIDHKMTHYHPEGREMISMDGIDTAIAIRATGFVGRIIGMCGSNSGIYGGSREEFKERGGLRLILKKPLNTHHLKEAILDTADEAVIALKFIQQRDLLKTKDINMAIKRLSVHCTEPIPNSFSVSNRSSPRSSPRLYNSPQGSPRLSMMAVQFDENDTIINHNESANYSEPAGILSSYSSSYSIDVDGGFQDGVEYKVNLPIDRSKSDEEFANAADKMMDKSNGVRWSVQHSSNTLMKKGSMSERTLPSMSDMSPSVSLPSFHNLEAFPPKPEKADRSQTGPLKTPSRKSSHSISHFTPHTNDFQWNLKTPNILGKLPNSELSLNSLDFYSLDWKSNASAREEESHYDSEKGPPSENTSVSRRGSGTSINMSSNNSIDSFSQSTKDINEYDVSMEVGTTLFTDRELSNSNRYGKQK